MFLDEGPRSGGKVGRSSVGNAVRIRPGGEGRRQTAHPDVEVCCVWCVLHVVAPGPTKAGRAQQEAGQVKIKVAGPCLGRRRREQGTPTTAAGRAACIKTRRCGVGGGEVENRKQRKKKKKKEKKTKQKRDEREMRACVCQPGQNRDAAWMGVVSLQASRGVDESVQQQANLELSPGWVY